MLTVVELISWWVYAEAFQRTTGAELAAAAKAMKGPRGQEGKVREGQVLRRMIVWDEGRCDSHTR